MVTISRPERLTLPLGPAVAVAGGVLIALMFLLMPTSVLEGAVAASGFPAIIAAAEPPLGFTARIALALLFGGGFLGFAWFGLNLVFDGRSIVIDDRIRDRAKAGVDKVADRFRRRDVHPDGPPRPPLFAKRDLGTPFLDVKAPEADGKAEVEAELAPADEILELRAEAPPLVERDLPRDLDRPLADYDPAALLDQPLEPIAAVTPLIRPAVIDPGDRMETFELTPMSRPEPLSLRVPAASTFDPSMIEPPLVEPLVSEPVAVPAEIQPPRAEEAVAVIGPETEATVHDLLARLERGLARPAPVLMPNPAPAEKAPKISSLQDTLGDLRRLATGGA